MNIQFAIVGMTVIIGLVQQSDVGPCNICHQCSMLYDDTTIVSIVGVDYVYNKLFVCDYIFDMEGRYP